MTILAFFLSPLGRWVAFGIAAMALAGGIWLHGDHNGASRIQGRWDAAVQATIDRGEKARSDAESAVDREPAGSVPNDIYDRDARPM